MSKLSSLLMGVSPPVPPGWIWREALMGADMPGYELYVENLRKGAFEEKGRQLRVVIGKQREIVKVEEL